MAVIMEEFGGRVASVWSELRPATRNLVERALQAPATAVPAARNVAFDARADLELSRLLAAMDERVQETSIALESAKIDQLQQVADICAAMLQEKTSSAEVFAQLVRRAHRQHDYRRIDALADALTKRFALTEICELSRSSEIVVRALAEESLAQFPPAVLVGLLRDPIDFQVARLALRRQALEYGSEEARHIVSALEQGDLGRDDL